MQFFSFPFTVADSGLLMLKDEGFYFMGTKLVNIGSLHEMVLVL